MPPQEWNLGLWKAPVCPDSRRTEPEHRISLLGKQEDFECCMLAELGMATKTIAGFTGLSVSQVSTRLKKAGIRVTDYRQGRGRYAELVFKGVANLAAKSLQDDLRRRLKNG